MDTTVKTYDDQLEEALKGHTVEPITMVVLVRTPRGVTIDQVDCNPAEREAQMARYGILLDQPLRSPRHAYAWRDAQGRLNVGGTSEKGKARLRLQYDAIVFSREDLISF